MEKTFHEVMNTIKDGETWTNKYKDRRLAKIQKSYNNIIFEFNNEYTDVGVNLNDIFVLDKKKYTFEEQDIFLTFYSTPCFIIYPYSSICKYFFKILTFKMASISQACCRIIGIRHTLLF